MAGPVKKIAKYWVNDQKKIIELRNAALNAKNNGGSDTVFHGKKKYIVKVVTSTNSKVESSAHRNH